MKFWESMRFVLLWSDVLVLLSNEKVIEVVWWIIITLKTESSNSPKRKMANDKRTIVTAWVIIKITPNINTKKWVLILSCNSFIRIVPKGNAVKLPIK